MNIIQEKFEELNRQMKIIRYQVRLETGTIMEVPINIDGTFMQLFNEMERRLNWKRTKSD
jgi:hypothetical protein